MTFQIPISDIRKTANGLSIFGSIPSTASLKRLANEWSGFRKSIKESGRRGPVGACPQVVDDGTMISVQALIDDSDAIAKAQVGVLRVFQLSVNDSSGLH